MASESGSPLTAVAIVELDTNKDVLLSWCYPSLVPVELEKVVPAQAEPILLQKPLVGAEAKRTSYFTRYGGYWLYGYVCLCRMWARCLLLQWIGVKTMLTCLCVLGRCGFRCHPAAVL